MYILYSFLLLSAAVLGSPYWLYKALRERKYLRNFRQRISWQLPEVMEDKPVWIHAVSVGEVLAAKPLLAAIKGEFPQTPVVVSTITLTGHALAEQEIGSERRVFYFPFDWSFCIRRFLRVVRPRAIVLMETELWPNFLRLCEKKRIPVFIANGRLSDRSFRRYRRFKSLTERMIAPIEQIGVQTQEDGLRFLAAGARENQIAMTGNLKFDYPVTVAQPEVLDLIRDGLDLREDTPLIVVGSSMSGEEPLILKAFLQVASRIPQTRLLLAPRHPERFEEVAEILRQEGIPFWKRTDARRNGAPPGPKVCLLNTIGELRQVYRLASVAVIGGSFLPFGGHNILEPAALGKAIIFGPHMSNFREMARLFLERGAARQSSPETLGQSLIELLEKPRTREDLGQRAFNSVRNNQGATQNTLAFLRPFIS